MRVLFLVHDDPFQILKAEYASTLYPVSAIVVVRKRRPPWKQFLQQWAQRVGVVRVSSEMAARLCHAVRFGARDSRQIAGFIAQYQALIPAGFTPPRRHYVDRINTPEAEALLRQLNPAVCVLMLQNLLKKNIFGIPPLGMLVYHPGVVPEYRGVHAAFWALSRQEPGLVGWSLLRVDAGIDTGPVLAQGVVPAADSRQESYVVLQHRAHLEGLPAVAKVLEKLAAGEQPRVATEGRESRNFSHPGLGEYLRYLRVAR